ncbi:MAG: LuxR C-terminal-related transcriptional regulator [Prevotellaceae bacterium]|jgi:DNA-binding NarL/FixJ family response regulator|nr:LuxR C-terminal-related transcriptional regulator [Prevotellaceae bacterium]
MSTTLKILLAEPSAIIRQGVLAVLKQCQTLHLEVFETSDAEHLKTALLRQKPEILIINPNLIGVLSWPSLKKSVGLLDMKCVVLQSSVADSALFKTYDEAISIYDTPDQICDKLTALVSEKEKDRRHELLSAREKEVIVGVINGMTNKQIADKLCLSVHTVITHRRNISTKLQIHSTAGLTIYAIVNKLVAMDSDMPAHAIQPSQPA